MMEWYYVLPSALALLLFLLLLGFPIFIAFLALNVAGVYLFIGSAGTGLLVNSIYSTATSLNLAAIPLFVVMGEILFRSGSVEVLFDALGKLFGRLRGRLYYFVISLSAVFGALSGSAIAVTAMLSNTALRSMLERGYDRKLSIGMVLSGASLAPVIPPSTLAVVIGSIADVSIARLLIAGLLPGLLMAAIFAVFIAVSVRLRPQTAPQEEAVQDLSFAEKARAFVSCLPFGIVIFGVMGFILLGIATATEAAATGVFASLIVAAYYRKLRLKMLISSIQSAVEVTCTLMVIIASSTLYTQLLAFTGASSGLVEAIGSLGIDAFTFTCGVLFVAFVMCMFIDQIAFLLLAIPIVQPIMKSYGIDAVHFWMLFLIFLSLGSNTPPFGYNLFTMKAVLPELKTKEIFAAAWTSVLLILAGTVVLLFFPQVTTFLPSLM